MKNKIYSLVIFSFIISSLFINQAFAQNIGSLKSVVPTGFSFEMDLYPGYTDYDVLQLQKVLNADIDTVIALEGDGSSGHETKYFGDKTKQAVIKFQNKYKDVILTPYGLTQGNGSVTTPTRTKLNLLIGVMNTYPSVGVPESTGVSTPPPVVIVPPPTQSTMSTCQLVEMLISLNIILPNQANIARSAVGCPTVNMVDVEDPEPSVSVLANGSSDTITVSANAPVTLSWTSSNVTSCQSTAGTASVYGSTYGSVTINVSTSTTYAISCNGNYGSDSDSIRVNVFTATPPPPPATFGLTGLSPANNAVEVPQNTLLSMEFNGNVAVDPAGYIDIKNKETFITIVHIPASHIYPNGNKVNATTTVILPANTEMYVEVSSKTFKNATSGVYYAGISGSNTWSFKTGAPKSFTVSCSPSNPGPIYVGTSDTWTAKTSLTSGSITYSWFGSITATTTTTNTTSSVSKTYSTIGVYSQAVMVSSGGYSVTTNCGSLSVINPTQPATTTPPVATTTATTSPMVYQFAGYGAVNSWMNVDAVALASSLKTAGLNMTQIEYLGNMAMPTAQSEAALRPKLKTFVTAMRAQGITTMVTIANLNAPYIKTLPVSFFTSIIDYMASTTQIGPDRVILEPVDGLSSPDDQVESNVTLVNTKANPIVAYAGGVWKGDLSYDMINSKAVAPANFRIADYALQSLMDTPVSSPGSGKISLVTTYSEDLRAQLSDGNASSPVFNSASVAAWACSNIKKGYSVSVYGATHPTPDQATISALGAVFKKGSSCTEDAALDALVEEEEGAEEPTQVWGYVTNVEKCTPVNSYDGVLWQIAVGPCKTGDTVTMTPEGVSSSAGGYVVIREGMQPIPTVGSTIRGESIHDGGLECKNPVANAGEYIGTLTGGLGIDPAAVGCTAASSTSSTTGVESTLTNCVNSGYTDWIYCEDNIGQHWYVSSEGEYGASGADYGIVPVLPSGVSSWEEFYDQNN
jgi:hypothetical protein